MRVSDVCLLLLAGLQGGLRGLLDWGKLFRIDSGVANCRSRIDGVGSRAFRFGFPSFAAVYLETQQRNRCCKRATYWSTSIYGFANS
ncbi:hypothetical protein BRADI_1g47945v3 [Brachypodium distachyon]|uniref:Secreted protein n=1 Tax=Brachypodium distachyon TaxID=15368 RepID=A0A0Q3S2K5_BRADI|nr:hypothetical protein BRADI_1g47945v3 [Brachypodium distachyon]